LNCFYFRKNTIHAIVSNHSAELEKDLTQLLQQGVAAFPRPKNVDAISASVKQALDAANAAVLSNGG